LNIIRLGASMLIGLFLVIILYFVISTPLESIMDGFDDADVGDANAEMDYTLPWIRSAMSMAFAIAIASPVVIFVFRTFEREPRWDYRRR
jgi:hypothetical protein